MDGYNEIVNFKNELSEFSFRKKLKLQLHYLGQKHMVWICTRDERDHLVVYHEQLNYPVCLAAEVIYEFFIASMVVAPNREQRWIFEQYTKEVFSEELAQQGIEQAEIAVHNKDEVVRCNQCLYSLQGWLCGQYHAANLERHRFVEILNGIIGEKNEALSKLGHISEDTKESSEDSHE